MNIFAIEGNKNHINWQLSARSLDNLRIVKMLLETTQLLCTALNENNIKSPYKSFNPKHPSCSWVIESSENWLSLYSYAEELTKEYTKRFDKEHKCCYVISECKNIFRAQNFKSKEPTPLKMSMPKEFQDPNDIVGSYRKYYVSKPNMIYPVNSIPGWFLNMRKLPYKIKHTDGKITVKK